MAKTESDSAGFAPETDPTPQVTGIPIDEVQLTTITFSELGENLPTGIFHEGERLYSYTLTPFTGELEMGLEDLFNSRKQGADKIYSTLRQFLPRAIKDIGGVPLHKLDSDSRRLIDRMDLGDVFSMLLSIRCQHHDSSDIAISAQCPNCNTVNADREGEYHDLNTVDIKCYQHLPREPLFDIVLEDGFTVTQEKITKLRMRPLRFYQLKTMGDPNNGKFPNLSLVSGMMHSFPDSAHYKEPKGDFFDRTLYARLVDSPRDKDKVFKALRKLQPGPVMSIAMDCINCGYKWKEALSWSQLPSFLYGTIDPIEP